MFLYFLLPANQAGKVDPMCYSAQASFLTAATLAPISGYCLNSSLRRHRNLWPLATIPIAFAIQQAMEGVIWTSLNHHNQPRAELAAKVYLLFAICWWPFWGPLTAFVASREKHKKRLFLVWTILSIGWFFYGYLPMLAAARTHIQATVVHHSIHYTYSDNVMLGGGNRVPVTILYLFFTAGPFVFQDLGISNRLPLIVSLISVQASAYFAAHAYTSVWCISAALLSSYCMVYFRQLDRLYAGNSLSVAIPEPLPEAVAIS